MINSKSIDKKRKMDEKKIEKIVEERSQLLYTNLVKWLYDNHKKVLREYEATNGTSRIEFLGNSNHTQRKEDNGETSNVVLSGDTKQKQGQITKYEVDACGRGNHVESRKGCGKYETRANEF